MTSPTADGLMSRMRSKDRERRDCITPASPRRWRHLASPAEHAFHPGRDAVAQDFALYRPAVGDPIQLDDAPGSGERLVPVVRVVASAKCDQGTLLGGHFDQRVL